MGLFWNVSVYSNILLLVAFTKGHALNSPACLHGPVHLTHDVQAFQKMVHLSFNFYSSFQVAYPPLPLARCLPEWAGALPEWSTCPPTS